MNPVIVTPTNQFQQNATKKVAFQSSAIDTPYKTQSAPGDMVKFSGKPEKHQPKFPTRGKITATSLGVTALAGAATVLTAGAAAPLFIASAAALGVSTAASGVVVYDGFIQDDSTLKKNFPLIGRARYQLEKHRPEVQQYFIFKDLDEIPISIEKFKKIMQMSKEEAYKQGFGSLHDMYERGFAIMPHTMYPLDWEKIDEPRINLGNSACQQPYDMSVFNISAMSYGSLSAEAVSSMNRGARLGNFAQNTGEGGISDYHLKPIGIENDYVDEQLGAVKKLWNKMRGKDAGNAVELPTGQVGSDLIWQLGTGYFGARTEDGLLDFDKFEVESKRPSVKAIELKLSQGAKPGLGGILPAEKNTETIAKARGIEAGTEVRSPEGHAMFDTPKGLLTVIREMKERSGGKPVGFKLCVGQRHEFLAVCKAMVEMNDPMYWPDFISVDGAEGGTGAAPIEFSNHVGLPLVDGLQFVNNALTGFGLRDEIKIIAAGKIVDGFDIYEKLALGADAAYSARGMMIATGCIQARECHNNTCPTGIATQDEKLRKGLNVEDKSQRVKNYHKNVMIRLRQLMGASGIESPEAITPDKVEYRVFNEANPLGKSIPLDEAVEFIPEGSLLNESTVPESFKKAWLMADPDSPFPKAPEEPVVVIPAEKAEAVPVTLSPRKK